MIEQKITVPLQVGDRVTLLEDVDIDADGGFSAFPIFEDRVEQYVPETGLLRFENSDIGRAEFIRLIEEAEGIEILNE